MKPLLNTKACRIKSVCKSITSNKGINHHIPEIMFHSWNNTLLLKFISKTVQNFADKEIPQSSFANRYLLKLY